MKTIAVALIVCVLPAAAAKAAIQSYALTGTVSEVQGNLSQTLQNMGVGPGDKIYGTVTFDDSAPNLNDPFAEFGSYTTGLNLTTTFYVLGSPLNFNSGPIVNDTLSIGNFNSYPDQYTDAFSIDRYNGVVAGIPQGFDSPAGYPVYAFQLKLEYYNLPISTFNSAWLMYFDVNLPVVDAPLTAKFQLGGVDLHGAGYTLLGSLNSFVPIPEPSTLALAAIGGLALVAHAARRRKSTEG